MTHLVRILRFRSLANYAPAQQLLNNRYISRQTRYVEARLAHAVAHIWIEGHVIIAGHMRPLPIVRRRVLMLQNGIDDFLIGTNARGMQCRPALYRLVLRIYIRNNQDNQIGMDSNEFTSCQKRPSLTHIDSGNSARISSTIFK